MYAEWLASADKELFESLAGATLWAYERQSKYVQELQAAAERHGIAPLVIQYINRKSRKRMKSAAAETFVFVGKPYASTNSEAIPPLHPLSVSAWEASMLKHDGVSVPADCALREQPAPRF